MVVRKGWPHSLVIQLYSNIKLKEKKEKAGLCQGNMKCASQKECILYYHGEKIACHQQVIERFDLDRDLN